MRIKNWKSEIYKHVPSFAPNTHKRYNLRHCINIVLTGRKNHMDGDILKFNK